MEWTIRFVHMPVLYIGFPLIFLAIWYRLRSYKESVYCYPMTHLLVRQGFSYQIPYKSILKMLRIAALLGLLLFVAQPQLVDTHSQVNVEGVDIMMVLDVSGSMQFFDDIKDRRMRIDVEKQEALNFIKKRDNDPIGIVLFARDVVSHCPLTLDKKMIASIINDIELGIINPDGTMLSKGLVAGINRLKKGKAKSKIVVLLTDGTPTEGDFDPHIPIRLAQEYGIKVYTIGIGGEHGGLFSDPLFGVRAMGFPINAKLLKKYAQETGGLYFHAQKPADLAKIYDKINQLEKTTYETNVYHRYYDLFMPWIWIFVVLLCFELFLATTVWFGV